MAFKLPAWGWFNRFDGGSKRDDLQHLWIPYVACTHPHRGCLNATPGDTRARSATQCACQAAHTSPRVEGPLGARPPLAPESGRCQPSKREAPASPFEAGRPAPHGLSQPKPEAPLRDSILESLSACWFSSARANSADVP